MSTETRRITVNGITVDVVRKDIRHLYIKVYHPRGRVMMSVPLGMPDEAVQSALLGKLKWIRRQQEKFAAQPRQSPREMVSGESHYFLGRRYRLRVHEQDGPAKVVLRNKSFLDLYVRPDTGTDQRERVLQRWYREQLRLLIPLLLAKWEPLLGVQVTDWGIKRMKTRWGTCNIPARRIWLNLELAKRPMQCLEYVVVHEMAHLLERNHNDRFTALIDAHLPQWRLYRNELNATPLAWETWLNTFW